MSKSKESKSTNLTLKQRAFVDAYMGQADGNATEAARLAGYKGDENTLASIGHRNARSYKIAHAIAERAEADPLIATRDERQRYLTRVIRGQELDKDGDPPTTNEKNRAIDLLAKAQGDYIQRIALEGSIQVEAKPAHDFSRLTDTEFEALRFIMAKLEAPDQQVIECGS